MFCVLLIKKKRKEERKTNINSITCEIKDNQHAASSYINIIIYMYN